jgi:hypothetical protein
MKGCFLPETLEFSLTVAGSNYIRAVGLGPALPSLTHITPLPPAPTHGDTSHRVTAAGGASITSAMTRQAGLRQLTYFELMACLDELFEPERSVGGTKLHRSAIPFPRLGRVGP